MDSPLVYVKQWRLLWGLSKTPRILGMVLADISQDDAQSLRDEPDGWSLLEILCHVRDFDMIYLERIRQALALDEPQLQPHDPHRMVLEHDYAGQILADVYRDSVQTRAALLALVESLDDTQLQRAVIHPEDGRVTISELALHVILHEIDHIDQMMRIIEHTRNS